MPFSENAGFGDHVREIDAKDEINKVSEYKFPISFNSKSVAISVH